MFKSARLAAVMVGAAFIAPLITSSVALADTSISAAGSTALQPLVQAAADAYQQAHPDIKISVTGGGSRTGLSLVSSKSVDLGDSDILAPAGSDALVDHRVAVIGFSVIVNPQSGVTALTKKQIQDIFTLKVKNWKDVGGKDQVITVINRPASSGTRAVFLKTVMGGMTLPPTLTEDATGTVVQKVSQTAGAISYAAFSGTHNATGVTEVAIDGAAASEDNITAGKYPFWSYEHMYTNGPPSTEISRFIAFLQSDSTIMHKTGYILIRDMKVSETDR
jgi:phosphate transport system substrate-binding protein